MPNNRTPSPVVGEVIFCNPFEVIAYNVDFKKRIRPERLPSLGIATNADAAVGKVRMNCVFQRRAADFIVNGMVCISCGSIREAAGSEKLIEGVHVDA